MLLPDLRGGGAERVNLDLAHEFARAGHHVEFILRQARGELINEARASFEIVDLGCSRVRQMLPALARYLRGRRPDALIVAMWPLTAIAPAARSVASRDTRVLVSEHGILSAQYRDWGSAHRVALRASAGLGYRLADARVGVSRGVADDMACLSGLGRERFSVINNPVPLPSEPSPAARAEAEALWGVPPGARMLSVGRLKRVKNQALLLHAFARLERADTRLMLVGDGELEAELHGLAAELGIADRVIFAGFHADPTPFYRTADLFVLSSDNEGFGNVIVEALNCGTPVVSTDCPSGPAEILAGGEYGTLVPVGDAEALSRAVEEALARPRDPERLRSRARDFSPEKAAKAYLDLLFPA
jgi:glycosyltransferase involved in cell wall biosynthesis